MLEAAYNDAAGVTARFNRNILHVVNRGLGADFQPEAFRHHAWYNAADEPHRDAPGRGRRRRPRACASLDLTVRLEPGESIWTESSYKFTRDRRGAMLRAGRAAARRLAHRRAARFALVLAAAGHVRGHGRVPPETSPRSGHTRPHGASTSTTI